MKKIFFALLLGGLATSAGCVQHTPHLYNPVHWCVHLSKMFHHEQGEFHNLHVDIDRVVLGVENYEELETSEYIYSE